MNPDKRKSEKGKKELLVKPKKAGGVISGSLQGWS